jgi:hypothetical protein
LPTIVLQPDSSIGKDSYVTSQYSSANYGNSSNIIVGIYNKYINRALVQISLPSELLGMIIDSAILSLTISSDNDYVQRPTICKITSAWVETTVNYSSCPAFTGGISGSKSGNTDLYDITSFVQDWANNEVNNGVILKAPSETALYTRIYYYSCEASTADYRPKLTITWHSPNTAPTTPMLTSQNDGGVLSSIQPIAWTESADAEGNAIQYEIVASEDDGSTIIPIASGVNEASINFDFSTLTPSQNWKIGIRATDGSLYSDYDWSDIPFTVMPQINPLVYNADFSTWILNGLMLRMVN